MIQRTLFVHPVLAMSIALLVLAGCNTRLNPFNWFGNSEEVVDGETGEINPLVPDSDGGAFSREPEVYTGEPIERVTDLRIERTRTGAIILAEGVAARQGPYQVQLTPANIDNEPVDGVLSYSFDIIYPNFATAVGAESTRTVTAAQSISNEVLEQVRVVRVVAAQNARESRR